MPKSEYGNSPKKMIKISFGKAPMSENSDYSDKDMDYDKSELVSKLKQVRELVKGDNKDDAISLLDECIERYGNKEMDYKDKEDKDMDLGKKLDLVMGRKG